MASAASKCLDDNIEIVICSATEIYRGWQDDRKQQIQKAVENLIRALANKLLDKVEILNQADEFHYQLAVICKTAE